MTTPILIFSIVLVITSVALALFVLMHKGRGGGLSDLFGGGISSSMGGTSVAERNLDRLTIIIGVVWLACTLGFEFLAGHYLFRKPWVELLADYDLRRGRIWIAVLMVTFVAPWWMAHARGLDRTWSR